MNIFALTPMQLAGGQIALAAVLAIVGFALLLPKPRRRSIPGGIAALVAAISVFGAWLYSTYREPMPDLIGTILFCLFSIGALVFGTVLVVQRNPARGALAFAFVILSTCGLFLLLAAPFLMAVTIIIYAGAIIVTFLFVLMLSQVSGPSDENDRSREPLFGSLAGFAFAGLVLFTIYLTAQGNNPAKAEAGAVSAQAQPLPAPVISNDERKVLGDAIAQLDGVNERLAADSKKIEQIDYFQKLNRTLEDVVGSPRNEPVGSIRKRLEKTPRPGEALSPYREDDQALSVLKRATRVRELNASALRMFEEHVHDGKHDLAAIRSAYEGLRGETLLLLGSGELPAHNVSNIAFTLYSERLLAVELAGTLLLVATIGAIAIAQRKGAAA